jgi:hypothetical protein
MHILILYAYNTYLFLLYIIYIHYLSYVKFPGKGTMPSPSEKYFEILSIRASKLSFLETLRYVPVLRLVYKEGRIFRHNNYVVVLDYYEGDYKELQVYYLLPF